MIEENLLTILTVTNIVTISMVVYLISEVRALWRELSLIPNAEEVVEKVLQTKVPIILGPDGTPKLDIKLPKKDDRPMGIG